MLNKYYDFLFFLGVHALFFHAQSFLASLNLQRFLLAARLHSFFTAFLDSFALALAFLAYAG